MEINDLGDLDLRPGRLTLWRISVPGTARWRPDPRRPSYVQEEHLRCFENGRPTWLGVTFEWSGEVDTTALSSAILGWVDRHEALRCRFDRDGTAIHLATVGPGAAALDLVELGDYADPGELARTLEDVFDTKTEPLSWPPHVFVTISRPGCTTLVIASDHSVTDAYSMASVPYEIRELYSAAIQGVAPRLAPAHSYLEYAVSERARVSDLTDGDPVIGHWRELIAATGGQLPDFPVSVGALGGAAACSKPDGSGYLTRKVQSGSIGRAAPKADIQWQACLRAWPWREKRWATKRNFAPSLPFTRETQRDGRTRLGGMSG